MRTLLRSLFLGVLAISSPLSANVSNWFTGCGLYDAGVDALYWTPVACPIDFAITTGISRHQIYSIKGKYDWGARARLSYHNESLFAQLSYLWFQNTQNVEISPRDIQSLFTTNAGTGGGSSRLQHNYQNVDLRFGCQTHFGCCGSVDLFANLRWAHIYQDSSSTIRDIPPTDFDQTVRIKAGVDVFGPGIGALGQTQICGDLGFNALFNVMALIGCQRTPRATLNEGDNDLLSSYSSSACVIPAVDLRLAFNYCRQCYCFDLLFELGYELNYYWDTLAVPSGGAVDVLQEFRRQCHNVGFAGPFISVTAYF